MEKWTYLGAIDDMVYKYPHSPSMLLEPRIDPVDILIEYALFGPPIILHQSALLQHHTLVADLLLGEHSIILNLIKHDRLRIMSRNKDFSGWPEEARKRGINNYSSNFSETELIKKIGEVDLQFKSMGKGLLGMPTVDCSDITHKLMQSVISSQTSFDAKGFSHMASRESVFSEIANIFNQEYARQNDHIGGKYNPPTRTIWENAVNEILDGWGDSSAVRAWKCDLMSFANECYHLAHSAALSSQLKTPICANTKFSNRFTNLLNIPEKSDTKPYTSSFSTKHAFFYPKNAIKSQIADFCNDLFNPDSFLGNARNQFTKFNENEDREGIFSSQAKIYGTEVYKKLALNGPDFEAIEADARTKDGVHSFIASIGIAGGTYYLAKHLEIMENQDYIERKDLTRRDFLKCAGMTFLGGYMIPNIITARNTNNSIERLKTTELQNSKFSPLYIETSLEIDKEIAKSLKIGCISYDMSKTPELSARDKDL